MEAEDFGIVNNIVLDKNIPYNPAILTPVISVYSIQTSQLEGLTCAWPYRTLIAFFFFRPNFVVRHPQTQQRSLAVVRFKAKDLAIE